MAGLKYYLPISNPTSSTAVSTTLYFKLEKDARQGDPISAYLFIIALEIIFAMIKSNPNIKGLNIFNHNYLYTAYTGDTVKMAVCGIKCVDLTTEAI